MIKLYQFPSYWGLPNVSPFCMKLETYLRMINLPFEIIRVVDTRKAPKRKLPYIDDNGLAIADTSLIIEYLKQKYGDTLDVNLSAIQKANALALQRLMEEHLYWCIVYSRWADPVNWPIVKKAFFGKAPLFVREVVAPIIRKSTQRQLYGHGMGRHEQHEIYQMGVKDLEALNLILNDHEYLMGNEPTSIDACGYAFIANVLHAPLVSPMTDYVKSQKNFVNYCARMKERFYKNERTVL